MTTNKNKKDRSFDLSFFMDIWIKSTYENDGRSDTERVREVRTR